MNKIKLALAASISLVFFACGSDADPVAVSTLTYKQHANWLTLQRDYAVANKKVGTDAEIGYKFEPSSKDEDKLFKINAYFDQETKINGNLATYTLTMKKTVGECKNGTWTLIYNADNPANPVRANVTGENCETLVEHFCSMASSSNCGMEEIPVEVKKNDAELAKEELAAAAKKWQKDGKAASAGNFFTFRVDCGEDTCGWYATSKKKIGECPAKSTISMGGNEEYGKWNDVPVKCKALAPEEVTSFKGGGQ